MSKNEVPPKKGVPIHLITPLKQLQLHLTEKGDFRHSFCPNPASGGRTMSPELQEKVFRWYMKASGNHNNLGLKILGGNPLEDFETLKNAIALGRKIATQAGKNIKFVIGSNATSLTEDIFAWAVAQRVKIMDIWADGYSLAGGGGDFPGGLPEDLAKNPVTWDELRNAVRLHQQYFPGDTIVKIKISPEIAPFIYEGAKKFMDEFPSLKEIRLRPDEMADWSSEAFATIRGLLLRLKAQGYRFTGRHRPFGRFICSACLHRVAVGVDGTLYPCSRFDDYDAETSWYNKTHALGHVDLGISNRCLFEDFLYRPERLSTGCRECRLPCEGTCQAVCYFHSGNVFDAPPICCLWRKLCLELEGLL